MKNCSLTWLNSSSMLAPLESFRNLSKWNQAAQQDLDVPQLAALVVIKGACDEPRPRPERTVDRQGLANGAVGGRRGQLDRRFQKSQ